MTGLFKFLLASHVFLGLVGVIASYAVLLSLSGKQRSLRFLKRSSLLSFLGYALSWISGGYYYVQYYGSEVKPRIMEGFYPWAHAIITESKEHIFLFLPFAALTLFAVFLFAGDKLEANERMRKGAMFLAATVTVVGTLILLAGVIISGGAR